MTTTTQIPNDPDERRGRETTVDVGIAGLSLPGYIVAAGTCGGVAELSTSRPTPWFTSPQ
jgi:hypothetical protein